MLIGNKTKKKISGITSQDISSDYVKYILLSTKQIYFLIFVN